MPEIHTDLSHISYKFWQAASKSSDRKDGWHLLTACSVHIVLHLYFCAILTATLWGKYYFPCSMENLNSRSLSSMPWRPCSKWRGWLYPQVLTIKFVPYLPHTHPYWLSAQVIYLNKHKSLSIFVFSLLSTFVVILCCSLTFQHFDSLVNLNSVSKCQH